MLRELSQTQKQVHRVPHVPETSGRVSRKRAVAGAAHSSGHTESHGTVPADQSGTRHGPPPRRSSYVSVLSKGKRRQELLSVKRTEIQSRQAEYVLPEWTLSRIVQKNIFFFFF